MLQVEIGDGDKVGCLNVQVTRLSADGNLLISFLSCFSVLVCRVLSGAPIPGALSWEWCWRLCREVLVACLPRACSVMLAVSGSGSPAAALPLLISLDLGFVALREQEPAVILEALTSSMRASHYGCHFFPKFLDRGRGGKLC